MPLRQLHIPSLRRSLSTLMACPSSAQPDTHASALAAYHQLGGNCLHLHGEGGETHSRQSTGQWLQSNHLRSDFFLCTQICHEGWDPAARRATDRCTPDAITQDLTTDLALLGTDHLDLAYIAKPPKSSIEPIMDAIAREIAQGRIRAFGVRNWPAETIRAAHDYALSKNAPGISAVITTELALLKANCPLWPEDIPFAQFEPAIRDLDLAVFAHADDFNRGQCLFDDGQTHPRWLQRWDSPANRQHAQRIRQFAETRNLTPLEISLAWLLNRPFPVIALLALPEFLYSRGAQLERASQLSLDPAALTALTVQV